MKKSLILPLLISLFFIIPSVSLAQTPVACNFGSSPTIAQLEACIADLQAKIAAILAQQAQGLHDGARVESLVDGLRVRQSPSTTGTLVTKVSRGAQGTIKTDCPSTNTPSSKGKCAAEANGYTWWKIDWDSQRTGWSVEGTTEVDYLQTVSGNQGTQTGNNTLRIKRAGADLYNLTTLQTSAWYDSSSPTSNNPADFKVSAGQHTAYTSYIPGYTIYAGTCTASDTTPNCSVNPSSITGHLAITPTCDQTKCSVPVQVTQNHAAKVVFEYVPSTSTSGQNMYYCHIPDYRVGQTLSQYTNTSTCNSNLATYMPGQTTGTCYPTSAAASATCVAGVTVTPPPATGPTPQAEYFPGYDWSLEDGLAVSHVFSPGTNVAVRLFSSADIGREIHAGGGVYTMTYISDSSHDSQIFGNVKTPFSKLTWPAGTWSVYTPGGATTPPQSTTIPPPAAGAMYINATTVGMGGSLYINADSIILISGSGIQPGVVLDVYAPTSTTLNSTLPALTNSVSSVQAAFRLSLSNTAALGTYNFRARNPDGGVSNLVSLIAKQGAVGISDVQLNGVSTVQGGAAAVRATTYTVDVFGSNFRSDATVTITSNNYPVSFNYSWTTTPQFISAGNLRFIWTSPPDLNQGCSFLVSVLNPGQIVYINPTQSSYNWGSIGLKGTDARECLGFM